MTSQWTPLGGLKHLALMLGRRMGYCALAWIVLYFATQWMRTGVAALFAMAVGALAGVTIGWVMGEIAEDSTITGLLLWVLVVLAAWLSMWLPEGILYGITGWSPGFGRWMMLTCATCFSLAAAVLRASAEA